MRAVIPYGFDPAQMAWNPAAEARTAELRRRFADRPLLFALGRHVYYKGFEVLIRAMESVDAVLMLGGTGPLTEQYRHQVARRARRSFRVTCQPELALLAGHIPEDERGLARRYYARTAWSAMFRAAFHRPRRSVWRIFWCSSKRCIAAASRWLSTRLGTGVESDVNRDGDSDWSAWWSFLEPHRRRSRVLRLTRSGSCTSDAICSVDRRSRPASRTLKELQSGSSFTCMTETTSLIVNRIRRR
jgi:hypothetical protein